jgi:hypothetical protein
MTAFLEIAGRTLAFAALVAAALFGARAVTSRCGARGVALGAVALALLCLPPMALSAIGVLRLPFLLAAVAAPALLLAWAGRRGPPPVPRAGPDAFLAIALAVVLTVAVSALERGLLAPPLSPADLRDRLPAAVEALQGGRPLGPDLALPALLLTLWGEDLLVGVEALPFVALALVAAYHAAREAGAPPEMARYAPLLLAPTASFATEPAGAAACAWLLSAGTLLLESARTRRPAPLAIALLCAGLAAGTLSAAARAEDPALALATAGPKAAPLALLAIAGAWLCRSWAAWALFLLGGACAVVGWVLPALGLIAPLAVAALAHRSTSQTPLAILAAGSIAADLLSTGASPELPVRVLLAVLATAGVAWALRVRPFGAPRLPRRAAWIAAGLAAPVLLFALHEHRSDSRQAAYAKSPHTRSRADVWAWLDRETGGRAGWRIGVLEGEELVYPLYGPRLDRAVLRLPSFGTEGVRGLDYVLIGASVAPPPGLDLAFAGRQARVWRVRRE